MSALMMVPIMPGEEIQQFCTFRIAEHLYGINIKNVKEINPVPIISLVPHTPGYIKGLVNIRGDIFLLFNLRNCFGFQETSENEKHQILLFKSYENEFSGIIVDRMQDVLKISTSQIELYNFETPSNDMKLPNDSQTYKLANDLVYGVYQLPNEILTILDIRVLFH